ncbi:MAG: FtsQ-type POTRA domain-containing protein [Desulforhopalus sp.]
MLLSIIKKISSQFEKNKTRENGYLNKDMQRHVLPGHNSQQGGQYPKRKNRLAHIRQVLANKNRTGHDSYKRPVSRKKTVFNVVGLVTFTFSLLLFIVVGGGQLIFENLQSLRFFQVSEIVISGTHTFSQEELRDASGIILHQTSLIGLDCSQVEEWLASVPIIARAEVRRNWPSAVEISIVENVPFALLHTKEPDGGTLQYIDRNGVPFLQVGPGADIDFPVITGLTGIDDPSLKERALAEVLVFLKKVNSNNPHLPAQSVSEIHVNRDGEMVVYLVEYPFPIFFGNSNTGKKYSRLVQVLKTLYKKQKGKEAISQVEYIQMDYLNDKVLVAQR